MVSAELLSDKYNAATPVVPPLPTTAQKECDYDANPTVLYQAIEAKQWEYAVSLFFKGKQADQSKTWVVRKETNGKLRWRLLPLHAAIIFGSPLKLVEILLADYPHAAQSKDDQGMLPLHLAFRNESQWEIIEELLTAFPQAVFVSDRKGRAPLQCGERSTNSASSISSISTTSGSKSFKSVVNVLDLFSQIIVSGERQKAHEEARKLTEARITQVQDTHLSTLTALKREWHNQKEESKAQLLRAEEENKALQRAIQNQAIDLSVSRTTEKDLTDKLRQLTLALNHANEVVKQEQANGKLEQCRRTNGLLRSMVDDLVTEQKACHSQFNELLTKYEKLVEEREQIQAIFQQQTTEQTNKESAMISKFKSWLHEKEKKIEKDEILLEEEKKAEEVFDYVERTTAMTSKIISRNHEANRGIIDLSDLGSPRGDP